MTQPIKVDLTACEDTLAADLKLAEANAPGGALPLADAIELARRADEIRRAKAGGEVVHGAAGLIPCELRVGDLAIPSPTMAANLMIEAAMDWPGTKRNWLATYVAYCLVHGNDPVALRKVAGREAAEIALLDWAAAHHADPAALDAACAKLIRGNAPDAAGTETDAEKKRTPAPATQPRS